MKFGRVCGGVWDVSVFACMQSVCLSVCRFASVIVCVCVWWGGGGGPTFRQARWQTTHWRLDIQLRAPMKRPMAGGHQRPCPGFYTAAPPQSLPAQAPNPAS
jgi:hypothetical protein